MCTFAGTCCELNYLCVCVCVCVCVRVRACVCTIQKDTEKESDKNPPYSCTLYFTVCILCIAVLHHLYVVTLQAVKLRLTLTAVPT